MFNAKAAKGYEARGCVVTWMADSDDTDDAM